MKQFIITEQEKKRIRGLYEQSTMGIINEGFSDKVFLKLKESIINNINELKKQIPEETKKVIDPNIVIDNIQNYLISTIQKEMENMKKGIHGNLFAYNFYMEVIKNVKNVLNNIGFVKKNAIKFIAPNKNEFLKNAKQTDISDYVQTISNILDFQFYIGWMDEVKPYEDNMFKWAKQVQNWINQNVGKIKAEIINLISNFIYGSDE